VPLTWSEDQNVVWKTPIAGRGWSSPVVWGKQVWLTTATTDGKEMSVMCLDRDGGQVVHDIKLFQNDKPAPINGVNSYASPTPAVEEGRVYAHFGTYGTACLDTRTAKPVWVRRDLNCNHEAGPGASPLLAGDRLYLAVDGTDVQYVMALDKATGKTVWKTPRSANFSGIGADRRKAFHTPTLIDVGGRGQLVCPGAAEAVAYEPDTGKEIWKVRYPGGYSGVSRPVLAGGVVVLNGGFESFPVVAVRPTGSGDVTATHVAWQFPRGGPGKTSPLVAGGLLYMLQDGGVLSCLEPATGQEIWHQRLNGGYSASPVLADGRMYLCDDRSTTLVLAPGREFKQLAANKLDAGCMASPAVAGKAIFLRTKTHVYRLEQR
jgi:outer membrane protein assembly factor BamB